MKCYKAKWIITSALEGEEVLEDRALLVDDGKIVDIIPFEEISLEDKDIKDLGNAVITPGFIDMLTQYQYTDIGILKPKSLKNKIKRIFKTLAKKDAMLGVKPEVYSRKWADILADYFVLDRNEKMQSFKDGVISSIKAGTTCFAQVSKEYKYFDIINKVPVKNYLFFEIFADSSEKSKTSFKKYRDIVENLIFHKGENTHIGIMLNSISGVHKKLWQLFSKYCRKHNMLLLTRFAESIDEIEWLEHGFSDIDLLHKFMGFRKITPYAKGLTPVEYLDNLKVLTKKVIVTNANYASESDLQELSDTGVKYVYQPLYSEEITNKSLPLETVLKYFKGRFGFSTQSFKLDKDFSLLKAAVEADKENILSVEELVKYLSIYPAKILKLDNITGSVEIGKDADFNVFKLADDEDYKAILKKYQPFATYSGGRKLVKNGDVRFSL